MTIAGSQSIFIIAGPNGAGKTTYAKTALQGLMATPAFVNADDIAKALNPQNPEAVPRQAGVFTLRKIAALVGRHKHSLLKPHLPVESTADISRRGRRKVTASI